MNVKVFNMTTGSDEPNALLKYCSADFSFRLDEKYVIQSKNGVTIIP